MSDEPPRDAPPDREPAPRRPGTPAGRPTRPGSEREEVPYVDDPWTKVFVAVVIVVFLAIFANAFLLGKGGLLTATPSPSPTPIATPTAVPSTTPTPSLSPTATGTPTATPTGTTAPSATP